jgi:hypothetical protein
MSTDLYRLLRVGSPIADMDMRQTMVTALAAKSTAQTLKKARWGKLALKPCVVRSSTPGCASGIDNFAQRLSYSS